MHVFQASAPQLHKTEATLVSVAYLDPNTSRITIEPLDRGFGLYCI